MVVDIVAGKNRDKVKGRDYCKDNLSASFRRDYCKDNGISLQMSQVYSLCL